MPLTERDNYLRNATFRGPEWIPCTLVISGASWDQWRHEMEEVLVRHPSLFPDFVPGQRVYDRRDFGPASTVGEDYSDAWGCVWRAAIDGLAGTVIEHPLADWAHLDGFTPPDPLADDEDAPRSALWSRRPARWADAAERLERMRRQGRPAHATVGHGVLFLLLSDLRGFDNLMLDMALEDERLDRLIEIASSYTLTQLGRWAELRPDVIEFGDDLGSQTASLPGPRHFQRYLAPTYRAWFDRCHQAGALAVFHSDGYIMDIVDPLLATGLDVINPQDLVNGVDVLAREVKGRVCIRLDIDRQSVLPYGTRQEIRELIEIETRVLGSPAGGLEFICGIYPPTAPDNVDALCCALEEFRTYWWD
ncbi:MAG: uroporphyrinogen decarboxylase family protein [Anaerolineae bacterium]|jgi:uroporphyrinogen decarboxylase